MIMTNTDPNSLVPNPGIPDPRSQFPGPETAEPGSQSPVPSPEIAISVQNLTKTYKLYNSPLERLKESLHPLRKKYHHDFYAINDVSFNIKRGETVGIIGHNGSGKSTLLKMITGVLTPTSGTVTVNGRISALLELGAGFNPELTGLENVRFSGVLLGFTREEMNERLDDILAFADIGEFIYQPVKTYSTGMFVRLAFAVAISVDPEILVVDEALSVGDARFQRKCYSRIEDFMEKNRTILFVSHDLGAIKKLCNTVFLLDAGRLTAEGEPKTVVMKYHQLLFQDAATNSEVQGEQPDYNNRIMDYNAESIKKRLLQNHKISLQKLSPSEQRHGNRGAEIIDFGILDSSCKKARACVTGSRYKLFMKVLFSKDVRNPFLAFAIRDIQGIDLFYTNNELLGIKIPSQRKNDLLEICSDITMRLNKGDYFLSYISLDADDNQYLDRRLDAEHVSVVSDDRNCGGYVDLEPTMSFQSDTVVDSRVNFYSQHGEDVLLDILFADKRSEGFFVEIGCIDGKRFSNTLTFEERGWKGLCIEAHPGYIDLLTKNRPNSKICHYAVGESDAEEVVFYANSRGSLSTLDQGKEEYFRELYGKWFTGFEPHHVKMRRIDTLLEENDVGDIDIMSLDVEGYEINALKGMSFERWKPKVFLIEADNREDEEQIDAILLPRGYKKIYRLSQNLFYSLIDIPSHFKKKTITANITHLKHPLDEGGDTSVAITFAL
jgi:FkbM family methyltransferase